jgi:hypothetical protein
LLVGLAGFDFLLKTIHNSRALYNAYFCFSRSGSTAPKSVIQERESFKHLEEDSCFICDSFVFNCTTLLENLRAGRGLLVDGFR